MVSVYLPGEAFFGMLIVSTELSVSPSAISSDADGEKLYLAPEIRGEDEAASTTFEDVNELSELTLIVRVPDLPFGIVIVPVEVLSEKSGFDSESAPMAVVEA